MTALRTLSVAPTPVFRHRVSPYHHASRDRMPDDAAALYRLMPLSSALAMVHAAVLLCCHVRPTRYTTCAPSEYADVISVVTPMPIDMSALRSFAWRGDATRQMMPEILHEERHGCYARLKIIMCGGNRRTMIRDFAARSAPPYDAAATRFLLLPPAHGRACASSRMSRQSAHAQARCR